MKNHIKVLVRRTDEFARRTNPELIIDFDSPYCKNRIFVTGQLHDDISHCTHDMNVIFCMPDYRVAAKDADLNIQFINYFLGTDDIESVSHLFSMLYYIRNFLKISEDAIFDVEDSEYNA